MAAWAPGGNLCRAKINGVCSSLVVPKKLMPAMSLHQQGIENVDDAQPNEPTMIRRKGTTLTTVDEA
ncbi:hypothetical protein N7539_007301 [Penicillium diatomitis]|uniref:Uncharacterized protein n=1 Tax=Penicillium diatomitis TaxID=2819901 RepID=A0A9X0BP13_9EURO|nr:uncharacterized protein N7539_007301 [Penicillium diatomitis]KAJ5477157.1 hypothetical protein N7539_007301 [Penicillium diatomitis]